ncbi:MAG: hypothetical protein IJ654_07465 [Bacteroidales bacterium]|nr:hypothetical protein [Bacteroidales bacterium]
MELYLVTTDHLEECIWFRDEEDFKAGMNAVAVLSHLHPVRILAFILMSNHVHFLLECTHAEAGAFINDFKRHHSRYMSCKYGIREMLRNNHADIARVFLSEESPERAIAYIQMNCVAANICAHPSAYPWGTGSTFFNVKPEKGTPVSLISKRERIRLLHSKVGLPSDYRVGEEGYILPESYVQVRFVESLFRSPSRMNFFLQHSSKARRRLDSSDKSLPAFKDQFIAAGIKDLCQSLFQKRDLRELDDCQLGEILKQIRYRFSSYPQQMARITGIPYERVVHLLDSY